MKTKLEWKRLSTSLLAAGLLTVAAAWSHAQSQARTVRILMQKTFFYAGEEQLLEFSLRDAQGNRVAPDRHYQTTVYIAGPAGLSKETPLTIRPFKTNADIQMRFDVNAPGKWQAWLVSSEFGVTPPVEWEVRAPFPRD